PLYGDVLDYKALQSAIARSVAGARYTKLAAWTFVALTGFSGAVALLAALRALTVLYGMRLWVGIVALLAYLYALMIAMVAEWVSLAAVGVHLWVFAAAIPLWTLWLLVRGLVDGSLLPRQAAVLGAGWALFAAALA